MSLRGQENLRDISERKIIVAWLRHRAHDFDGASEAFGARMEMAKLIEQGEHLADFNYGSFSIEKTR